MFYIGCIFVFVIFLGEKEMVAELEVFYGDIDVMELYFVFLVEKFRLDVIFGEIMVEFGVLFFLKGFLGNFICFFDYWKFSIFGGEVGFKIINIVLIQFFICNNVKGCFFIVFSVQDSQFSKVVIINVSVFYFGLDDVNFIVLFKERLIELQKFMDYIYLFI